jgi:hypothetical protein
VGYGSAEAAVVAYPRWPVFVPADGAVGHPIQAWESMMGEPIPDMGRRGCPLNVFFEPLTGAADFTGALEMETGGILVPVIVPEIPAAQSHKGIIPEAPLRAKTWYRATFRWTVRGTPGSRTIRFRTQ